MPDSRNIVGGKAHAEACHVTARANAKRVFGTNWSSKLLNGRVVRVGQRTPEGKLRVSWFVTATCALTEVPFVEKTVELNRRSAKAGDFPVPAVPPQPEEEEEAATVDLGVDSLGTSALPEPDPTILPSPPSSPSPMTTPHSPVSPLLTPPAPSPPEQEPPPPLPTQPLPTQLQPPPPRQQGRPLPDAEAHACKWRKCDRNTTATPNFPVKQWKARDVHGTEVCPGCQCGKTLSRLDFFLMMFPPS